MKTRESLKMLDKSRSFCCGTIKTIRRVFDAIFSLTSRQTTICIAVHQIALSSFLLVIMLVGVSHAGEMQSLLHSDMADEAERRSFYEVDELKFGVVALHEGDGRGTNNQRRFATAQHRATMTELVLYAVTVLMALYLACSAALLHGAVRRRREYVMVWLFAAPVTSVGCVASAVLADEYKIVQDIFGSRHAYRIFVAIGLLSYIYGILCVGVFAMELGACAEGAAGEARAAPQRPAAAAWHGGGGGGDRGERLLLLDRAAHSNVLSEAQLHRLTTSGSYQFV